VYYAAYLIALSDTGSHHLAVVLQEYLAHYNTHRPHRSLDQHPPAHRTPPAIGATLRPLRRDRLGGLIHEYLSHGVTGFSAPTAAMATEKKVKHTGEKAKGKVKEAIGKVTGKKRLEAKGKADQGKADVKQSGKKVKNAAKKVTK
jgi:uncharacterized protein YjbJ (UPF0337 family)